MLNEDINVEAEADPKRPNKLYAAMLSAFLTSLVSSNLNQPAWAVAVETAVVCSIAVYLTRNPINIKKSRTIRVNDDPALFD